MADKPAPEPGHFLPGREGRTAGTTNAAGQTGGSTPLTAPTPRVFFGAAKATFPLRGELLAQWSHLVKYGGDEHTKDKVRDHGSSASLTYWMNRGFASTDLATCNTFVAPSAQVS